MLLAFSLVTTQIKLLSPLINRISILRRFCTNSLASCNPEIHTQLKMMDAPYDKILSKIRNSHYDDLFHIFYIETLVYPLVLSVE
jgi:hypothetical protein